MDKIKFNKAKKHVLVIRITILAVGLLYFLNYIYEA